MRNRFRLNQTQLADRVEVTQAVISRIEKGIQPPSEPILKKLKLLYGINRDWLMDGEGKLRIKPNVTADRTTVGEKKEKYQDIEAEIENYAPGAEDYEELEFEGLVLEYSEIFNRLKFILKNAPESVRYKVRGFLDEEFVKIMREKKKSEETDGVD